MDALDLLKRFESVAGLNDLDRPNEIGSIFDVEVSVKSMDAYEAVQITRQPIWLDSIYYVITRSAEHKALQRLSLTINIDAVCIKSAQILALFGASFTVIHSPPPIVMENDAKTLKNIREAPRPNSFEYQTILPGRKKSVGFSFGYTPCLRHFSVKFENT